MAEERAENATLRSQWQSLKLLNLFWTAIDYRKLLLAAVGILVMSFGWWLLSVIFFNLVSEPNRVAIADEYKNTDEATRTVLIDTEFARQSEAYRIHARYSGPGGKLRTMPWYEDRGPNPYLLGTSLITANADDRRDLISRFLTNQIPVLIEPLVKFITPVTGLIAPGLSTWTRIYLFMIVLWTLATWAFFGGVITRLAIAEIAGYDQLTTKDAFAFVGSRYLSYLFSPMIPIGIIFAVAIGCMFYGVLFMIPGVGDFLAFLWPLIFAAGFVMTIMLLGLIVYPLMYATISAEGADTLDGMMRPYNLLISAPWTFLWYGFLSVIYGAVLVFFVVFVSSFMVYLGKAAVNQTPGIASANMEADYLFVYAPSSFGWQELLLKGSPIEVRRTPPGFVPPVTPKGELAIPQPSAPGFEYTRPEDARKYLDSFFLTNYIGAGLVNFWTTLLFLMMLGFGYSFFWTSASMIYLLLRKKIDETELDEIYVEDEQLEAPVAPAKPVSPASPPAPILLSPPTLRTPPVAPPTPPVAPPVAPPVVPPVAPPVTPPVAMTPPVTPAKEEPMAPPKEDPIAPPKEAPTQTPEPNPTPPVTPPTDPVPPPAIPPSIPPAPQASEPTPEPKPEGDDGESTTLKTPTV